MGGFRPSDLIQMLISQLDPLTEQQVMGIYGLQHSSQQAEEALSQGLEQLQQSLVDTIAGGAVADDMAHMVVALGQLTNLEGFVRQSLLCTKKLFLVMVSSQASSHPEEDYLRRRSTQECIDS
ncbi:hypothetical protein PVL29_006530 [Vitis rotundifolia]|uniref:DOG1 domain-containing protein n=1 Tax=Vitis rotundifolia TaxID=103349 RepID=A0AA39A586_VITRO|nr:hypothetical protein PVL29_006530 [Vitis rotundifolia]